MMPARETSSNRLLAMLSGRDFALLKPSLARIDLPVRRQLEVRNRRIEHVYFPESGMASVVTSAGSTHSVEVAMIGNEGMTGFALLLDCDRGMHETFVQSPGEAWRITAEELRAALEKSVTLHQLLLRYVHTIVSQMAFTALANGRYKLEERLARWLLMSHDRTLGEPIHLTHEFLSVMLGARRPGITNALNGFERRGLLDAGRGVIAIRDRGALEDAANGSYGGPEAEYQRLLGTPLAVPA